jgi:hypothetical protein
MAYPLLKKYGLLPNTLLHRLQMLPVESILTQTPGHDTTQLLRRHDILELAIDQRRGIPGPEEIDRAVPVVLTSSLLVRLAVLERAAPGISHGDALALAVVGETTCLAEIVAGAAVQIN